MSDFVHGDQADRRESHDIKVSGEKDLEASLPEKENIISDESDLDAGAIEAARARELQRKIGFLSKLRAGEDWLDRKMGIETQGVDRILEEDKKPPSIINAFFMWWSLTCHVGTLPLGVLGPELGLSLKQSVAAIVVGTVLGALCTAYTGTLGPRVSTKLALLITRNWTTLMILDI